MDLAGREIELLKREIADIEGVLNGSPDHGTRAVLFQIPIDYGAQRGDSAHVEAVVSEAA